MILIVGGLLALIFAAIAWGIGMAFVYVLFDGLLGVWGRRGETPNPRPAARWESCSNSFHRKVTK